MTSDSLRSGFCALVAAAMSGCFVGVSGGAYAVMGGNERYARVAPSVGLSAGIVYDAYVARVAAGAGGEALFTSVETNRQAVLTGPGAVRLDLATNWSSVRSPQFRLAAGGTFGAGSRMVVAADGALVAQPYGVYHAFFAPSMLAYLGNPMTSMLALDLSVGPGLFFARDQRGITDLWGVGGEIRAVFSIPLTQAGIQTFGHMVANTQFNWPTITDEDVARARAVTARDAREREAAARNLSDQQDRARQVDYCRANGGANCDGR